MFTACLSSLEDKIHENRNLFLAHWFTLKSFNNYKNIIGEQNIKIMNVFKVNYESSGATMDHVQNKTEDSGWSYEVMIVWLAEVKKEREKNRKSWKKKREEKEIAIYGYEEEKKKRRVRLIHF